MIVGWNFDNFAPLRNVYAGVCGFADYSITNLFNKSKKYTISQCSFGYIPWIILKTGSGGFHRPLVTNLSSVFFLFSLFLYFFLIIFYTRFSNFFNMIQYGRHIESFVSKSDFRSFCGGFKNTHPAKFCNRPLTEI